MELENCFFLTGHSPSVSHLVSAVAQQSHLGEAANRDEAVARQEEAAGAHRQADPSCRLRPTEERRRR